MTERAADEAHGKTCALELLENSDPEWVYSLVSMHGAVWGHMLLPLFVSYFRSDFVIQAIISFIKKSDSESVYLCI